MQPIIPKTTTVVTFTDPEQIIQLVHAWVDQLVEDEGYDGYDIDPYDDERERGQ